MASVSLSTLKVMFEEFSDALEYIIKYENEDKEHRTAWKTTYGKPINV